MPCDKIIEYYLLCSVGTGKTPHPLNEVARPDLEGLLTRNEPALYLKSINGRLIANEAVVGGADEADMSIMEYVISG